MRWEALEHWGADAARIEPLGGGVVNEVWSVHVNGQLAVGRFSVRWAWVYRHQWVGDGPATHHVPNPSAPCSPAGEDA
jgi:hypothetical protein